MAANNLIDRDMVNIWVKLRNKSAHPVGINQEYIDKEKFIKQIDSCIVLFYQLIFNIIHYEGKYIDYSSGGWPTKKFKISPEI